MARKESLDASVLHLCTVDASVEISRDVVVVFVGVFVGTGHGKPRNVRHRGTQGHSQGDAHHSHCRVGPGTFQLQKPLGDESVLRGQKHQVGFLKVRAHPFEHDRPLFLRKVIPQPLAVFFPSKKHYKLRNFYSGLKREANLLQIIALS